jgi:hypothetical protein
MMGTEDRLKGILARQVAAANKARKDQEAADEAAEKARKLRAEVAQKWTEQRIHIEHFIDRLNQEIRANGQQLYVRGPRPLSADPSRDVDEMDVGFEQYAVPGDMRKLLIRVGPNGEIYVHIATRNTSPVKHYTLNAFEATEEKLEGAVLDFLDENTPK